jgi:3-oxoacyl-[acyl-carrier-protein] synthase-1
MSVLLSAPGLVCCAGNSGEELFDAALRGDQSGIRPVSFAGRPVMRTGGRSFLAGVLPLPETAGRLDAMTRAALEQIRPLVETALAACGADRIAVCAGSCDNGSEYSLPAHRAFFSGGAFPPGYSIRAQSASRIAEYAAACFGLAGPCLAVAAACASSAGAFIKGAELIESGIADAVIAGGADLASETALLGFAALEAVSDGICNPFSRNRGGITLGEGAAFFLMCREGVLPPSAGPRIELIGYGESADAHHMTAPRPDGSGALAAMRRALRSAGIAPSAVDYINLHGTGTALNDQMEAAALAAAFGGAIPPVSSTKPITGHTLGAAGAIELAICWMALARASAAGQASPSPVFDVCTGLGDTPPNHKNSSEVFGDCSKGSGDSAKDTRNGSARLPAHCWDGERDPDMPFLNFVADGAVYAPRICMSNSFAFGGCNVSLILGRRD